MRLQRDSGSPRRLTDEVNGLPRKTVIDRSGASTPGINTINRMLKRFGCPIPIELVRIKHLNNMVEHDHRTIKKRVRPMLGFKSFASASATLEGIEMANMIRKGQISPGPARLPSSQRWQRDRRRSKTFSDQRRSLRQNPKKLTAERTRDE